jgi:2-polyprenyl-3-methyl-5-hydroxy-6-metoxy-1,4-benzoquinol methylase
MAFDISTPPGVFHAPFYIRHNQRRLEHLASLGLDLVNKTVLEPGAGMGDHSLFYLDRGCAVTALEPRAENIESLRSNVLSSLTSAKDRLTVVEGDVSALAVMSETFDVVHSYGLLYHLSDPAQAISLFAARCRGLLCLETCVSMGNEVSLNPVAEPVENPAQAYEGTGCRPTRPWLMGELKKHFPFVYVPRTQPAHDEFPLDWTRPWPTYTGLVRAVFVASRQKLENSNLLTALPDHQTLA